MSQEELQRRQQEEERIRQEQEMPRIPFSREDLINAHTLRNTEFREALIEYINSAQLYASAKRALRNVVNNYFSSNWFLSNLEKGGRLSGTFMDEQLSARLALELDLIMSTTSFCPSDNNSPDMLNIVQSIYSHSIPTRSRTKGMQRERLINAKFTMASEATITRYEAPPSMPQAKPDKKPWISLFGRGK
jgi:hypothetical protein